MAATGWDSRFPDVDGWFGTTAQHDRRDAVTTDGTIRSRAVRRLEYLEAVHGMREQPVRDIVDYQDRCWWAGNIPADLSCVLTATGDEAWMTVSKAQVPSAPSVPEDVAGTTRDGQDPHDRQPDRPPRRPRQACPGYEPAGAGPPGPARQDPSVHPRSISCHARRLRRLARLVSGAESREIVRGRGPNSQNLGYLAKWGDRS